MRILKAFGAITSFFALIYCLSVISVLGYLLATSVGEISYVADYYYTKSQRLFLSQYLYDITNDIPEPVTLGCIGGIPQMIGVSDDYHKIIGSSWSRIYMINVIVFDIIWGISSFLVLLETCCSRRMFLLNGWIGFTIVPMVLHLIVTVIHCTGIAYPIELYSCFPVDFVGDVLTSELIFPSVYSGGFFGWILLAICHMVLICLSFCGRKKPKPTPNTEIIYAHSPPATNAVSMNPFSEVNQGFQGDGDQGFENQTESRRSSGDIYSRRSSRANVPRRNVTIIDAPTSNFYESNDRPLQSSFFAPVSIGIQTSNDIATQTPLNDVASQCKPDRINKGVQPLIFTRSPNKPEIIQAPGVTEVSLPGRGALKYPPQPPPLPLPNMDESSPDQPWKLILRNRDN